MENNQKDFMKNRPVAAFANQTKDVFGSQKQSTRTTVTAVLILLMTVLTIIFAVNASWIVVGILTTVLLLLLISLVIGRSADRANSPVEPQDSPEAIFKEHDV